MRLKYIVLTSLVGRQQRQMLGPLAEQLVCQAEVQVVDGAEVVVLDGGLVDGDGVGDLHRRFDIEGRR